ncbi:MAG: hypothetical protein ACI3V4_04075 [Faecousia sp.]
METALRRHIAELSKKIRLSGSDIYFSKRAHWRKRDRKIRLSSANRRIPPICGGAKKILKKRKIMLAFSVDVCYYIPVVRRRKEISGCGEVWYRA